MSGQVLKYGIVEQIPIDKIDESPFQIRMSYGDIDRLARDIKKRGLLQPILVRPINKRYEIVHGHRRFKAIKSLNWNYIYGVIRKLNDESALLVHGAENIQRKNLSHIEEARLYRKYMETMKKAQDETANDFEVSPDTVRYKLTLLDLPDDIQQKIHEGIISYSKGRQLAILTREPYGDDDRRFHRNGKEFTGQSSAIRTERFYPEIRKIAEEPSLKTEREVAETAKLVREGVILEEAVSRVKKSSQLEQINKGGRDPKEILKELENRTFDDSELSEARADQYKAIVLRLIARGWLNCPDCGESKLVWDCCGRDFE